MDDQTDRKAAIIHVNNYNREQWIKRVGEHGLSYRDIRYSEPYEGFSHKHFPTDINDPERITYAVIAESDDIADKMEEAELEFDEDEKHNTVGELLGFPDCCRDFFDQEWLNGRIDPMYEITCNSGNAKRVESEFGDTILVEDPNPGACVMWRYFGLSFITHLPCSWDCEHAIDVGRERYRVMKEAGYEDAADAMYQWLSLPFQWSGYHGIADIKNRYVTGCSQTSSYWEKKTIKWGGDHEAGGQIMKGGPTGN
ncbi:MAG: hypothetical protein ABEH81_01110 [Halopenitus sp.]